VSERQRLARLPRRELEGGLIMLEACDRRSRLLGLAGLAELPGDMGLILPVASIHTVGLRFPLDLIWCDGEDRVIRVDRRVPPRRIRICRGARSVIEVNADHADRFLATLGPGVTVDPR
jgi:uncharacterized membrane protein (UPF0127 family)